MNAHNEWVRFVMDHPQVEQWLQNRPSETRRNFAQHLMAFCEATKMAPEAWRELDRFAARDLAWSYVAPLVKEHPTVAKANLVALKSWYRNRDGEQLPFDSGKGGKHYFRVSYKKRASEHIPNKREVYQIVDMASNLRDKALLLFLFQSGCRVNVLESIRYGAVADQLDNEIMVLKITGDLDSKLKSRDIPFYYTFLNGEGSDTLKRYCQLYHKDSSHDKPLFYTKGDKPISSRQVWTTVKRCVREAGFNPKTITTHTIRKAFRRQLAQASNVEFEFKEMIMGHVLPGSREHYFDRHNVTWFIGEYEKLSFGREAVGSETMKLRMEMEQKLREKDEQIDKLRARQNQVDDYIQFAKTEVEKARAELLKGDSKPDFTEEDLETFRQFMKWREQQKQKG